jgi:hypothetical protein
MLRDRPGQPGPGFGAVLGVAGRAAHLEAASWHLGFVRRRLHSLAGYTPTI